MNAIGRIIREAMGGPASLPGASSAAIPVPSGARRGVSGEGSGGADASLDVPPERGDGGSLLEEDESEAEEHEPDEAGDRALDETPATLTADSDPLEAAAFQRATRNPIEGDPLARLTVADAMLRTPRLVPETEPLPGVTARLDDHGRALMVVNANGELVGIVTASDLRGRSAEEAGRPLTAGDVAVRRLVTARPDESLRAAARRMSRVGLRQLPVVAPDSARPLGLLRRSDILQAYVQALGEESAEPQQGALEERAPER